MAQNKIRTSTNLQKKNDTGRSMVEMLGTLAVIGVLSVGGIMGYRYAMDKYRANQTLNDVNLRAQTIETQLARGIDVSLSEFSRTSSVGYTFEEPILETDAVTGESFVELTITGLEKNVCQIVKDSMPIYEVIVNENTDCDDLEAGNVLTFIIDEGTDEEEEESEEKEITPYCEEKCPEGQFCEMGKCVDSPQKNGTCTTSDDCEGTCSRCVNGNCTVIFQCMGSCNPLYTPEERQCKANGYQGLCDSQGICKPQCQTDADCGKNSICTSQMLCEHYIADTISIEVNGIEETWLYVATKHMYSEAITICEKKGYRRQLTYGEVNPNCPLDYGICLEFAARRLALSNALHAKGYSTNVFFEESDTTADIGVDPVSIHSYFIPGAALFNILCRE